MTPAEAAKRFGGLLATAKTTQLEGQGLMASVVKQRVQETYGDASKLQELAPSTQAERVRLGYEANMPLVRTGELLRDSIRIEETPTGFKVGSDEPIAAIQEFGSVHLPPRPAIAIGTSEARPEVEAIMGATALAILGDRRRLAELTAIRAVTVE